MYEDAHLEMAYEDAHAPDIEPTDYVSPWQLSCFACGFVAPEGASETQARALHRAHDSWMHEPDWIEGD